MHYQFIDRILEVDAHGAGKVVVIKTFPRTEDYFDGTFRQPDEVPSSLLLETMASAGALVLGIRSGYHANAALLKVNRATFSRPVFAGAALKVRLGLTASQGDRLGWRIHVRLWEWRKPWLKASSARRRWRKRICSSCVSR